MWNPFAARPIPPSDLGRRGERRAAWFYRLRGYSIVAQNARWRDGEIDLIARRGRMLVIAEVKTRQTKAGGEAFEAVDRAKREQMVRLATRYTNGDSDRGVSIRYDIVSLFWTGRRFELTHFEDAFRPVADPLRPWIWRA